MGNLRLQRDNSVEHYCSYGHGDDFDEKGSIIWYWLNGKVNVEKDKGHGELCNVKFASNREDLNEAGLCNFGGRFDKERKVVTLYYAFYKKIPNPLIKQLYKIFGDDIEIKVFGGERYVI